MIRIAACFILCAAAGCLFNDHAPVCAAIPSVPTISNIDGGLVEVHLGCDLYTYGCGDGGVTPTCGELWCVEVDWVLVDRSDGGSFCDGQVVDGVFLVQTIEPFSSVVRCLDGPPDGGQILFTEAVPTSPDPMTAMPVVSIQLFDGGAASSPATATCNTTCKSNVTNCICGIGGLDVSCETL